MKIPINQIIIGQRQRIDLGDLSDLESMADKDVGQILPIIVHKTLSGLELVDGRRRLEKATQLGWTEVEITEKDQLTPVQKQKMELLADIGRKDRTWQEVCIAIYKIDGMLKVEKQAAGERWTVRAMAAFTGYSKTRVSNFLNLAEVLLQEPKDEEAWGCGGVDDLIKLLLSRQVKLTQREQEERRQRLNQMEIPSVGIVDEEAPYALEESGVQILDKTSSEGKLVIPIRGTNIAFEDAVFNEHFVEATAVLAYNPKKDLLENIQHALRDEGMAVIWHDNLIESGELLHSLITMPFPIIWNKVSVLPFVKSNYPFVPNYAIGTLYTKENYSRIHDHHYTSTMSVTPDDSGDLPSEIVAWTLEAICPPGIPVLCPCNAPVVAVAQTGRIPIFFEEDKEKFEKKCHDLKQWYKENVPNVDVKMP